MSFRIYYMKQAFSLLVLMVMNHFLLPACGQLRQSPQVTVKPVPNYGLTSEKTNTAYLRDGVLSKARNIWTDPATLGWMNTDMVTLTFDLGEKQSVSSVSVHTARGEHADVSYPLGIYVFASQDNKQFSYIGDAVKLEDDLIGSYNTRNFSINSKGITARFIVVKVVPNGTYFFCDEVNIKVAATSSGSSSTIASVQSGRLDEFVNKLRNRSFRKRLLLTELAGKASKAGTNKLDINNLKQEIERSDLQSDNDFDNYKQKVLSISATLQGAKASALKVVVINPWDNTIDIGDKDTDVLGALQLSTVINGVHYGAFKVLNTANTEKELIISLNQRLKTVKLELFESYFVNHNNFKKNLDPLLPHALPSRFKIGAGEVKYFFVRASGLQGGTEKGEIQVTIADGQKYAIPIQSYVAGAKIDFSKSKLNAVNWAYYNLPALKGMEAAARQDLLSHHINTITVSPSVVPPIANPNDDGHFTTYLKNCGGFDNMILFLDLSKQFQKDNNFFNTKWKGQFLSWYDHVMNLIRAEHFSNMKVYIFPFDEAKQQEVAVFRNFTRWLKQQRPDAKVYATSISDDITKGIAPYVDIVQVLDKRGSFNAGNTVLTKSGEIWMYDTKSPASALPPHQYYRLLAWKAYALNMQGIGFWNYIYGDNNSLRTKLTSHSNRADNSVIYTQDKKLITTRRWEAFRQGMEEYTMLKAYEKQYGRQKALTLCLQVLGNENDIALADQVRRKLLQQLK